MGYDFRAKRKGVEGFHLGAFSWAWMLDSGLGLIVGYQPNGGGQHIYTPREVRSRHGTGPSSPASNDGFPVSATEARAMAMAARGLAVCERCRAATWKAMPEGDRAKAADKPISGFYERDGKREMAFLERDPRLPTREDFIEKAEAFAAWAEASGGFRIY